MTPEERIAALTRGYVALANFRFNKFKSSAALFDLVMETKSEADDAIDREVRDEVRAKISAMPPPQNLDDLDE